MWYPGERRVQPNTEAGRPCEYSFKAINIILVAFWLKVTITQSSLIRISDR